MLEEIGERYEHIPSKPRSNEIRKINRTGKVPVLLDGEEILTDSSAIISYLGNKHEKLSFQVVQLSEHGKMQWFLD